MDGLQRHASMRAFLATFAMSWESQRKEDTKSAPRGRSRCHVTPPPPSPLTQNDFYTVHFTAARPGVYELRTTLHGIDVRGSPVHVVVPGPRLSPLLPLAGAGVEGHPGKIVTISEQTRRRQRMAPGMCRPVGVDLSLAHTSRPSIVWRPPRALLLAPQRTLRRPSSSARRARRPPAPRTHSV